MVRTTSSQNKKYTCKNNVYEKKKNSSSSIYFYFIVRTNSSLMELRELHALVTGVTVTSYSYSTGYSYSSIIHIVVFYNRVLPTMSYAMLL
jgi:hypothetical protein